MDADRFALPARTFAARRRALVGALSAAVVLTPRGFRTDGIARKTCKRRKKRKKPPSPTCAASCPSNCFNCFLRPAASTLCGDGVTVNCSSTCTSDQDCVGTMTPYCASKSVNRVTGEVKDVGEVFGVSEPCCIAVAGCL